MTSVLIGDRRREDTKTQRESSCEDGGRDWSDAFTSQGRPRVASCHQELREGHGRDSQSIQEEPTLQMP